MGRLMKKLIWLFTIHFGLRGRQEHVDMKMEDFIFKELKGSEFEMFYKAIAKTIKTGLREKI